MIRHAMAIVSMITLGLLLASPLAAQRPEDMRREMLRRQVMERFMENFRTQAGLTPEQERRFRQTVQASFQRRREIETRQRELFQALEAQLRPGVAADEDRVTVLLDGVIETREAMVEHLRADQQTYAGFLTPVQRALLALQFERFQQQIENLIRRRVQDRPRANEIPPGGR